MAGSITVTQNTQHYFLRLDSQWNHPFSLALRDGQPSESPRIYIFILARASINEKFSFCLVFMNEEIHLQRNENNQVLNLRIDQEKKCYSLSTAKIIIIINYIFSIFLYIGLQINFIFGVETFFIYNPTLYIKINGSDIYIEASTELIIRFSTCKFHNLYYTLFIVFHITYVMYENHSILQKHIIFSCIILQQTLLSRMCQVFTVSFGHNMPIFKMSKC